MKEKPDYTRCEHRFYFKDTEEWSSWSESFEPGKLTSEIESELAEVEIRNVEPLLTVESILPFISQVTENAVNYTNNTIREEVKNSIENLETAVQQIQDGETDPAIETIFEEIKYLSEREELWRIHMEDVGDEAAQSLKSMREGENQ